MKQKRALKYRFYPTDEQKQILARTFGCARFVYNWALRLRSDAYYKRRHQQHAEYTTSAFQWKNGQLTLAKMTEPLDIVWSRPLPKASRPSTVTITKDSADRYFVSILVEENIEHRPPCEQSVGADLGLKDFVILST